MASQRPFEQLPFKQRPNQNGRRATALLFFVFGGCGVPNDGFRTGDQLQPEGPCWSVNIGDGLDESSAQELQDVFACVDQTGTLRPLAPAVATLDHPARDGMESGALVAHLINRLPDAGIDVWALAAAALELLDAEAPVVEPMLELVVELTYGRAWGTVVADVDLTSPAELSQGVVTPLLPLLPRTATLLLDEAPEVPAFLADVVEDDAFADTLCTLVGIARSDDADVRTIADQIMGDLGEVLLRTTDPSNDRWADASGNSARDLISALLTFRDGEDRTFLEATEEPLGAILRDETLEHRLEGALEDAVEGDHLDPLPLQLLYLAEVTAEGASVTGADDSALLAFLRLLDSANQPMECSLDLWVTNLEINLGNLSVEILRILARIDPDTTETGVALLGEVLGWGFSQATMNAIADSGVCPVMDRQLIADMQAVDRFNDPETGDLLVVMLDVLAAFVDTGTDEDRVPELVDVLAAAHATGLVPPVEELLRDAADTALMGDLTGAIPLILDPSGLVVDECPPGSQPLDLPGAWGLLRVSLVGGSRPAALTTLAPLAEVWVADEATWTGIENLGVLLRADGARVHGVPELIARVIGVDPDLSLLRAHTPLLRDPALVQPMLKIVENAALFQSLAVTSTEVEGPLPFVARLIVGGTLTEALRTVDLVVSWLTGVLESPAELEES